MNARTPAKALQFHVVTETTVFQSGNSQAVRIPKEFQFDTKRVEIFREGNSIVLRPLTTTAAEALADLPPLSSSEGRALDKSMDKLCDLSAMDEPITTVRRSRSSRAVSR